MRLMRKLGLLAALAAYVLPQLRAQDLAPRAYTISPLHWNAITLTYGFYSGNLLFDGAVPIKDATGRYNVPVFSIYHSFRMFGHFANFTASLPYAVGNFQGTVRGEQGHIYRSGLLDSTYRLAVNLKGGPPMEAPEFFKWKQKTLIGVSLKMVAPTGQYDPSKLINWGANRWAFKPELGVSTRRGKWVLDGYGGVWFYTSNPSFFSHNLVVKGNQEQSQRPIGALEGHLSYDWGRRTWISLDGNFWFGGVTSLNNIPNLETRQTSSRIGATGSIRLSRYQSLKFSYSDGAYVRFGGNYQSVSVAWQYAWIGRPK
jgi:hypothetical protein